MYYPASLSKATFLLIPLTIIALLCQHGIVSVGADSNLIYTYCTPKSGSYVIGDTFQENLGEVLPSLSSEASGGAFFSNVTSGSGDDQVYGLYYCSGAIEAADCSACVDAAVSQIQSSCATKEAIVWYLECTLRYANRDIFSRAEGAPYAYLALNQVVSDRERFSEALATAVLNATDEAAKNNEGDPPGYAWAQSEVSSTETVVVIAQCTPDILGSPCTTCLTAAIQSTTACCNASVGSLVFLPSCELLYAITDSSDDSSPSSDPSPTTPSTPDTPSTPATPSTPSTKSTPTSPATRTTKSQRKKFPFSKSPSTTTRTGSGLGSSGTSRSSPSGNEKASSSNRSLLRSSQNVVAGILLAIGFLIFMPTRFN